MSQDYDIYVFLYVFLCISAFILFIVIANRLVKKSVRQNSEKAKKIMDFIKNRRCIDPLTKEEFIITGAEYDLFAENFRIGIKNKSGEVRKINLREVRVEGLPGFIKDIEKRVRTGSG